MNKCPCHSGEFYHTCCQPFHTGTLPKTALQLMRSRYAAYSMNLPDYIILTTHPENKDYQNDLIKWKKEINQFSKETIFVNLSILDFDDSLPTSTVTFQAFLKQKNRDVSFIERSYFEQIKGHWLYLKGEFILPKN